MLKHILFFLSMLVFSLILNLTLSFYDQDILEIIGLSFAATFFNWFFNLPTSKENKSVED
ncbi:hypothetical protein AOX59_02815 [Lentibacillus amyloliquefaciens]|jgi:hypothetical protein|uniref:Uncharacterized protein n=1 Tax=Lentibacillus amyloliquefaciens TaxID=1472767 RepID=A0A0U4G4P3_9BACI|nr:hypothetical protein AOX59_02160 [Lentibacillus amyloliquefaciens]ALX47626.1 hypothetical protein AOX59_02815 [Lentibacillus amyloliquefaciens]